MLQTDEFVRIFIQSKFFRLFGKKNSKTGLNKIRTIFIYVLIFVGFFIFLALFKMLLRPYFLG